MNNTNSKQTGQQYLAGAINLLHRLQNEEWSNIAAAAAKVTSTLTNQGTIHAFGTGHSHMLAEELFYRAGGLVKVRPILFEGLMLHASAPLSTQLERLSGLAKLILDDHGVQANDIMFVFSNSGRNPVVTEMAEYAKECGLTVVAIASANHANAMKPLTGGRRLSEIADIVINNGGAVGDASVRVPNFDTKVAPTSTVVGAAVVNAIVAETVSLLVSSGITPEVFFSSNVDSGDAINANFLSRARY